MKERDIYLITLGLNLIYVILELTIGLWANSLALIADASHNISDMLSISIAWLGVWLTNRPKTDVRTYGFRRASLVTSMYIGISMVGAGTAIGWGGIDRLISGQHTSLSGLVLMGVASIGIAINLISAWLFQQKGKKTQDISDRALSMELFYDGIVSLLVVIGGLAITLFNWMWVDSALALLVSVFILWSAFRLVREVLNLLMDAVPTHINTIEVRDHLLAHPGVTGIHDLHVWAMSARHLSLTAHLTAPDGLSDESLKTLWHSLATQFGIDHSTIQVEKEGTLCPQKDVAI